jgi:hypothetical protein
VVEHLPSKLEGLSSNPLFVYLFFSLILQFELRVSQLQGRHSTT